MDTKEKTALLKRIDKLEKLTTKHEGLIECMLKLLEIQGKMLAYIKPPVEEDTPNLIGIDDAAENIKRFLKTIESISHLKFNAKKSLSGTHAEQHLYDHLEMCIEELRSIQVIVDKLLKKERKKS